MTVPELPGERGRVRVGGDTGYPVVVGPGVLAGLATVVGGVSGVRSAALVSDDNVMPLHGRRAAEALRSAGLRVSEHAFPAGEASKTRATWGSLTDDLLQAGHGRDACVVAVGGGVTTDLAGFLAATYLRGVPIVQVPTSMLAMIDASTGAKTGVDVPAGKNLVGAFWRPEAVLADVATLETLPRAERAQGLVEAVKHGAILDEGHFSDLETGVDEALAAEAPRAAELVLASVALKGDVVDQDELEGGLRQILNFGHTIGHAIEAAAEYRLGHGSAVALGMVAEARIGERMGITEAGTSERLDRVLRRLLGAVDAGIGVEAAADFLGADKKVRDGRPRFVLLERIGRCAPGERWTHEVPAALVHEALSEVVAGLDATAETPGDGTGRQRS